MNQVSVSTCGTFKFAANNNRVNPIAKEIIVKVEVWIKSNNNNNACCLVNLVMLLSQSFLNQSHWLSLGMLFSHSRHIIQSIPACYLVSLADYVFYVSLSMSSSQYRHVIKSVSKCYWPRLGMLLS